MDPRLIAAAIPVFFALMGLELWLTRRSAERYYRFHDSLADLGCGITQQALQVFFQVLIVGAYALVYSRWRVATFSPQSLAGWMVLLALVDLSFYWFHRTSHRVNALWAAHVVHHQSEEYNLSVALRQSWFEPVFSIPFHLPLAVIGFPPAMFLAAQTVNVLYQFWVHTRGVRRIGPLEWVMNTPSHHRVHHGKNPEYIDRNYGGMFIFWDRLFGTFQSEGSEPVYGTVKPFASFHPAWANAAYWVDIAKLSASATRLSDKMFAWVAPPEWRPAELGGVVVVPKTSRAEQKHYDVTATRAVNRYVAVAFFFLVLEATALIVAQQSVSTIELAFPALVIVAGASTISGLLEAKRWARWVEGIRLIALPACVAIAARRSPLAIELTAACGVVAAVSGVWLASLGRPRNE